MLTTLGIDGVRVGHWTDADRETGCTVIEYPPGTVASFEARGGAPASRELELLHPDKTVTAIDAVLLTGGSAFGLAAADGVMRYYEERRRGVRAPSGVVPIVPTLALYDLGVGDGTIRPTPANGYSAAEATAGPQAVTGRIGAGAGAYVAHWRGAEGKRPAGLASHVVRHDRLVVSALCAVNAFGDVTDGSEDFDALRLLSRPFGRPQDHDDGRRHTTIGVVSTNARIDKAACRIVAQGAHDGLARSITPPHTRFDGDAFIAAATGAVDADIDLIRYLALVAVTKAIAAFAGSGRRSARGTLFEPCEESTG